MSEARVEEEEGRTTIEIDRELVDNIEVLVESGERGMVLNLVADMHPADLALMLSHLPFEEAHYLFRWLPIEAAGEVLTELDDDYRALLLEEETPRRLTALIDELDTDDAADVLADLPDAVAEEVLPTLEDADDLARLLRYDEDTAGGIMAVEYVAVPKSWTVEQATEEVRRNAETVEQVYVVFVVDEAERLEGVVTLKRLLLSPADARIADIMKPDMATVTTDMDQEEVARIMERYDLVSLAVVDDTGRLVGRVTIDDIVDVIREEAEEDIQRMSGVAGGEEPTDTIYRIIRGRLPWLLAGLFGAGLAALVIGSFEEALQQATILAGFIPIVMATAGNAGIQSSAIAVQGLASGDVWSSHIVRRLSKELVVAMINGLAVALVLGVAIVGLGAVFPDALPDAPSLALTAALALVVVIIIATTVGATIPLVLDRMHVDPALATGPFITTSNDIIGILIFFLLAQVLYI